MNDSNPYYQQMQPERRDQPPRKNTSVGWVILKIFMITCLILFGLALLAVGLCFAAFSRI